MKYTTLLATLVLSLHTSDAVESSVRGLQDEPTEDTETGLRDTLAALLDTTVDTAQNVDVPALSGVFGENSTLSTVTCDAQTLASSSCNLLSGVEGVNVCRKIGLGVEVSVCAPKVLGNYIGAQSDTCGCCGGPCYSQRTECKCTCQDGDGVMVRHNIAKVFGRQVSWKACYTPTVARQVLDSRPEFECWDGCDMEDDTDYDTPTQSVPDDEVADTIDSNVTEAVPLK